MSEWDRARRLLDVNSAAIFVRGGSEDGRSVMNDHRIAIDEETDHAHDDRHPLAG